MRINSHLRCLTFALCWGLTTLLAQSPQLPLPVRVDKIESTKVGETREFWVSLPDGYTESTERFPVVYMMDGDFNFTSGVIGGLRLAAQLGEIPEFILVGIRNTNRSLDIFPEVVTYPDGSKDGGRANQYLDFIRHELIPHIEKTYRTEPFRVLYGTSNSGFTAVHALFRDPSTANAYIAASATLSIASFRAQREALVRDYKGGRRSLLLVMGEYDYPTVQSLNGALREQIQISAPEGLSCRLAVIPKGEHVPPNALLEGLRGLFDGWKPTQRLTESSYAEIRAQVDNRPARFGLPGKLPEDALRDLGRSLLDGKKFGRALEIAQYRVDSYPQSADAQVGLGDAHRGSGDLEKARACYRKALSLSPGHASATSRLKEVQ
jgi:uncharacterized protein